MNHQGKSSGLALIAILIVALIIAYLAAQQFSSLGMAKPSPESSRTPPIEQAQDAVRQINAASQKTLEALKDF